MTEKTATCRRYSQHKYWGKKPAAGLAPLIERYSKAGDTVLDPFAGYGVFCCEAFLRNRNVIVNDLNPAAGFIERNLFAADIDLQKVQSAWEDIRAELQDFVRDWYTLRLDGTDYYALSVLRSRKGLPLQFTYRTAEGKTAVRDIPHAAAMNFCKREAAYHITDWFPDTALIPNARISAGPSMKVADLFTVRTLSCHARLYALINRYSTGTERDLLLLAFTANLANCSRLVPPIKSRGSMAQGAWMTGFYVGETFIENNVLHYFENRLRKAISGKAEFLQSLAGNKDRPAVTASCTITCEDARALRLPDASVDYVFTDPPYGDSVPYFEQSIIWNAWLRQKPRYKDEIVISDSRQRAKGIPEFEQDMDRAIAEVRRVLRDNKYFSLTFHSLSGMEWRAISNACVTHNFELADYQWLTQKTFTPRQLNRLKSVKGDVLLTFCKRPGKALLRDYTDLQLTAFIKDVITQHIAQGPADTNTILMAVMKRILQDMIRIGRVDVFEVLSSNFVIDAQGTWSLPASTDS